MPETLSSAIARDALLRVTCLGCGHSRELDLANLVQTLGPDFPVPEIGKRARCRSCGHLGAHQQVPPRMVPFV